jgi:hypothetical protein
MNNATRQQFFIPSPAGRRWRVAPDEGDTRMVPQWLETEFRAIARIFGGRGGRTAVRPYEGWAGRKCSDVTWQGEHAVRPYALFGEARDPVLWSCDDERSFYGFAFNLSPFALCLSPSSRLP